MSFYVYMLECADGSIYTGHTDELGARLAAHQLGPARAAGRPSVTPARHQPSYL